MENALVILGALLLPAAAVLLYAAVAPVLDWGASFSY